MWMIVEMKAVLRRAGLTDQLTIMLKDIVISDISTAGIRVVVDMIYAKPIVDPAGARGVAHFGTKSLMHDVCLHGIELVPIVVVRKQVRIHYPLHCRLQATQLNFTGLKTAQ